MKVKSKCVMSEQSSVVLEGQTGTVVRLSTAAGCVSVQWDEVLGGGETLHQEVPQGNVVVID